MRSYRPTRARGRFRTAHIQSYSGILFLACVLFNYGLSVAQTARSLGHSPLSSVISAFETDLASDVSKDGVGGISAGIVIGETLVWSRAFGWADVQKQTPFQVTTIGRTGSISKSLTAILMMQLVESGTVDLDTPVAEHLPEIKRLKDENGRSSLITYRLLASHTAGLIREPRLEGAASGPISFWEGKGFFRMVSSTDDMLSSFSVIGSCMTFNSSVTFLAMLSPYSFRKSLRVITLPIFIISFPFHATDDFRYFVPDCLGYDVMQFFWIKSK